MDKPTPIKEESRICFGIEYYATEKDADLAGTFVEKRGDTYNGGSFHGMGCGRELRFDHERDGQKFYSVTIA